MANWCLLRSLRRPHYSRCKSKLALSWFALRPFGDFDFLNLYIYHLRFSNFPNIYEYITSSHPYKYPKIKNRTYHFSIKPKNQCYLKQKLMKPSKLTKKSCIKYLWLYHSRKGDSLSSHLGWLLGKKLFALLPVRRALHHI